MILRGIIAGVLATLAVMGGFSVLGQFVVIGMAWVSALAVAEAAGALAGMLAVAFLYEEKIRRER